MNSRLRRKRKEERLNTKRYLKGKNLKKARVGGRAGPEGALGPPTPASNPGPGPPHSQSGCAEETGTRLPGAQEGSHRVFNSLCPVLEDVLGTGSCSE